GSGHRDLCIRRQVPRNRSAEHPVADDQEIHDWHHSLTPAGGNRMLCADTGNARTQTASRDQFTADVHEPWWQIAQYLGITERSDSTAPFSFSTAGASAPTVGGELPVRRGIRCIQVRMLV